MTSAPYAPQGFKVPYGKLYIRPWESLSMKNFFAGILAAFAGIVLVGYVAAIAGLIPANADAKPSRVERWFAQTALQATIRRQSPERENPLAATDANLIAGVRMYKQNCAVCHGGAKAEATNIARGLYQRPPQLAKDGVEDDPASVTYWKIAHGIRLTGMPAFSKTLTDTQVWQIALFLQRMDRISPGVKVVWER
jgi:mono/diheme cytochrome c family protein